MKTKKLSRYTIFAQSSRRRDQAITSVEFTERLVLLCRIAKAVSLLVERFLASVGNKRGGNVSVVSEPSTDAFSVSAELCAASEFRLVTMSFADGDVDIISSDVLISTDGISAADKTTVNRKKVILSAC